MQHSHKDAAFALFHYLNMISAYYFFHKKMRFSQSGIVKKKCIFTRIKYISNSLQQQLNLGKGEAESTVQIPIPQLELQSLNVFNIHSTQQFKKLWVN